jgi:hypothetical protein
VRVVVPTKVAAALVAIAQAQEHQAQDLPLSLLSR